MRQIEALAAAVVAEWQRLDVNALRFAHVDAARLALAVMLAVCATLVILRSNIRRRPGRHRLAVPAQFN